jgi:hypothetical protein
MTFLADGAPYTFLRPGPVSRAIAVGWLDPAEEPATGAVPEAFVAELRERCTLGVNKTRGRHPCLFCSTLEDPALVNAESAFIGEYMVGNGEIYVGDADGRWYAAPNLVIHYVEAHGYRPPDEFIAAVLARAGDLRLQLSPRVRETLARLLRIAAALRRDGLSFVSLPNNISGDLGEFRRTVHLPLHGAPSTGEFVVPQADIGPVRDVLDSLDVFVGGPGSRFPLNAREQTAVERLLAQLG